MSTLYLTNSQRSIIGTCQYSYAILKGYPQYDFNIFNGWGSLQKLDKLKFLLQLVLWARSAGLTVQKSLVCIITFLSPAN